MPKAQILTILSDKCRDDYVEEPLYCRSELSLTAHVRKLLLTVFVLQILEVPGFRSFR